MQRQVVEAYRLDRYDNTLAEALHHWTKVVEAYRLDRYDNPFFDTAEPEPFVVEAYRLDRYDNFPCCISTFKSVLL